MKYPLEIELTDYCGLKCKSCINPLLKNKGFISINNYKNILNYIYNNKDEILYINFSGIGDIFLHKEIIFILKLFIEKFRNTGISVLIPTKGQSINKKHINILNEMLNSGIKLNISIGIYSLIEKFHNKLSGSETFYKTINFIRILKKNNLRFSLELLNSKNIEKEKKIFNKFINKIGVGGSIHNYHNFGGAINNDYYKYGNEKCSFDGNGYNTNGFYCEFIPFISKNGNLYSCSISGKNKEFYIGDIKKIFTKFPKYKDLIFYIRNNFLNVEKCHNCSIYKFSKLYNEKRKNIIGINNNKSM